VLDNILKILLVVCISDTLALNLLKNYNLSNIKDPYFGEKS